MPVMIIAPEDTRQMDALTVCGTPDQIELLVKICESLKQRTFIRDLTAMTGRAYIGGSDPPLGSIRWGENRGPNSHRFAPEAGGTPETPLDTTVPPTPPLAGKKEPVNDDREGQRRGGTPLS